MSLDSIQSASPWPHRLAVLLVAATFPLIWVGGLVTTYDAGMAVPDWPGTYGYNLFLYPWQTWLAGPWDLFIEHGHRLLGAVVGLLTIALACAAWRGEPRGWVRKLTLVALLAVLAQGLLGGARVLLDERQLALLHGCTGPAFFGLATALAVITSSTWREARPLKSSQGGRWQRLSLVTSALAYGQLLIGAHLRHTPIDWSPHAFRVAVVFHLLLAGVLLLHACWLAGSLLRRPSPAAVRRPALGLAALILVQLLLGAGSWVTQYAWPSWLQQYPFAAGYTVEAKSLLQSMVVTAHVAAGSWILAVSILLALRTYRLVRALPAAETQVSLREVLA